MLTTIFNVLFGILCILTVALLLTRRKMNKQNHKTQVMSNSNDTKQATVRKQTFQAASKSPKMAKRTSGSARSNNRGRSDDYDNDMGRSLRNGLMMDSTLSNDSEMNNSNDDSRSSSSFGSFSGGSGFGGGSSNFGGGSSGGSSFGDSSSSFD